jgi:SAM-dependent methyltransferase
MQDRTADSKREQRSVESGVSRAEFLPGFGHDWLLPLYDPFHKLFGFESYHRLLVEQAAIQPANRVLEIGCGTGNLLILTKQLHSDADVVGLDPDSKALARARRKARRESLSIELDHGFAQALPYPDASFDRVLSAFMFHHLELDQKRQALREARRVLRPGGSLHLVDLGGTDARSDGLVARLSQRNPRLADNFGARIPALLREAGFGSPMEIDHVKTVIGRFAYYRGEAPSSGAGDDHPEK